MYVFMCIYIYTHPSSGERSAVDDRVQRCGPEGCTSSLSLGMLRCMMQEVMSTKVGCAKGSRWSLFRSEKGTEYTWRHMRSVIHISFWPTYVTPLSHLADLFISRGFHPPKKATTETTEQICELFLSSTGLQDGTILTVYGRSMFAWIPIIKDPL